MRRVRWKLTENQRPTRISSLRRAMRDINKKAVSFLPFGKGWRRTAVYKRTQVLCLWVDRGNEFLVFFGELGVLLRPVAVLEKYPVELIEHD